MTVVQERIGVPLYVQDIADTTINYIKEGIYPNDILKESLVRETIEDCAEISFSIGAQLVVSTMNETLESDLKFACQFAKVIIASEKDMTNDYLISRTAKIVGIYLTGLAVNRAKQQIDGKKAK